MRTIRPLDAAAVAAVPVVKPFRKGVPSGCFTVRSP